MTIKRTQKAGQEHATIGGVSGPEGTEMPEMGTTGGEIPRRACQGVDRTPALPASLLPLALLREGQSEGRTAPESNAADTGNGIASPEACHAPAGDNRGARTGQVVHPLAGDSPSVAGERTKPAQDANRTESKPAKGRRGRRYRTPESARRGLAEIANELRRVRKATLEPAAMQAYKSVAAVEVQALQAISSILKDMESAQLEREAAELEKRAAAVEQQEREGGIGHG